MQLTTSDLQACWMMRPLLKSRRISSRLHHRVDETTGQQKNLNVLLNPLSMQQHCPCSHLSDHCTARIVNVPLSKVSNYGYYRPRLETM